MRRLSPLQLLFGLVFVAALVTVTLSARPAAAGSPDLSRSGKHTVGPSDHQQRLQGDIVIGASAGTQLVTAGRTRVPIRPNRPDTPCHTFIVESGRLSIDVPAGDPPARSVLVRTPHRASFVSLGGSAEIVVGETRTTIAVRQGAALVASGNDWSELGAGKVRTLRKVGKSEDRDIVGAPSLTTDADMLMAPSGGTASTTVRLTPVPGAARYELTVRRVSDGKNVGFAEETTKKPRLDLANLAPGRYVIRARARDRDGIAGPVSQPASVQVAAFEPPDGAVVKRDTIWLFPGQRVQLVGASALELTYGTANRYFVKAPRDVGLLDGQKTVVRLRRKGSAAETRLVLQPRPHTAEIRVGPEGARWPRDLVEIRVTVFDSQGAPAPLANVDKRVIVNGRELDVTWSIQGARQRTALAPPTEQGPWNVEVIVADDIGTIDSTEFRIRPSDSAKTAGL